MQWFILNEFIGRQAHTRFVLGKWRHHLDAAKPCNWQIVFAPDRLVNNRIIGADAWHDILDAGAIIVCRPNARAEVGSPLIEFYAAVALESLEGFSNEDWHPE